MSHEQLLSTVTADDKHSRLDLVLSPNDEGEPALELRRLSWGKGVGWYRQHTLRLDPGRSRSAVAQLTHQPQRVAGRPSSAKRQGHPLSDRATPAGRTTASAWIRLSR